MNTLLSADPTRSEAAHNEAARNEYGERPAVQHLVMVDDRPMSLRGFEDLVTRLHGGAWQVDILETGQQLIDRLDNNFPDLPDLVSIDLGLPPDRFSPKYGLELLERVHQSFPGLKIVVHSGIVPIPELAAQYILSVPATYISTASDLDTQAYAHMLPWIAKGFLVYSPVVSDTLSHVVLRHPDPLDAEEWRIVELVSRGLTNYQIAQQLNYAENTIQEKVTRIGKQLNELGHIDVDVDDRVSTPFRYREPLTHFYQENAVRYGRQRK
jgi:DNA-binding NarL/FixJ family response regulator